MSEDIHCSACVQSERATSVSANHGVSQYNPAEKQHREKFPNIQKLAKSMIAYYIDSELPYYYIPLYHTIFLKQTKKINQPKLLNVYCLAKLPEKTCTSVRHRASPFSDDCMMTNL